MPMTTSKTTLSRIAREASVSLATVSKVLNGRDGVAAETRAKVETLLREQGYKRPISAGPLGGLVEIVFNEIDSSWSIELIKGVVRAARENNLSVILSKSGDRSRPGAEWLAGVLHRRPIGVILIFSDLTADDKQQLRARNVPFVIVDPAGMPSADVPSIGSANWSGGYEATKHLLDLGHTRIGMVTGAEGFMCSRARVSGFRSAIEAVGLEVDESLIVRGDFTRARGIAATNELLSRPDRPTGIVTGNDVTAFGAYEAALAHGLVIPRDLSIVGYDDIEAASWVTPQLTTIRQPLGDMAEEATRLLLKLRSQTTVENVRLDLAIDIIVRGSTSAPPHPSKGKRNSSQIRREVGLAAGGERHAE